MHSLRRRYINANITILLAALLGIIVAQGLLSFYLGQRRIADAQREAAATVEAKVNERFTMAQTLMKSLISNPETVEAIQYLRLTSRDHLIHDLVGPIILSQPFQVVVADMNGVPFYDSRCSECGAKTSVRVPLMGGEDLHKGHWMMVFKEGLVECHHLRVIRHQGAGLGVLDMVTRLDRAFAMEILRFTGHHLAIMNDHGPVVVSHPKILALSNPKESFQIDGRPYATYHTRIRAGSLGMRLLLLTDLSALRSERYLQLGAFLLVVATLFVIALFSTGLSAKRFSRPLERLSRKARVIAGGNYAVRMDDYAGGIQEIAEICDSFNHMAAAMEEAMSHLERALADAEVASKSKGQFLSNMSHEIRTPMNAIIGFTELTLNSNLTKVQQEYLTTIQASSKTLLGVIDDILDFSKIEAGKLELEEIDFSMAELLDELIDLFRDQATRKGLELVVALAPDVPGDLRGDPLRLRQILINLIGNAIKFTDQGEVHVRIDRATAQASTLRLRFQVSDTGIGITDDHQKRLFSSFSQADDSTTRKFGGTGLGLAISRHLATLMGGQIDVQSEEGAGTTFHFTLSFAPAVGGSRDQTSPTAGPDNQPADAAHARLQGCHVLLVEDNIINQRVATAILKKVGLRITTVENGRQAVEKVLRQHFDAVLMDIQMPEMDGHEATRKIRAWESDQGRQSQHTSRKPVPIIAMTAHVMRSDRESCLTVGMDDYLTKPIDAKTLYNTLAKWMGKPSMETMAAPQEIPKDMNAEPSRAKGSISIKGGLGGADFPDRLPGVDSQSALERLGGNRSLFRKLLLEFVDDYQDIGASVGAALCEGDKTAASHLAHTIKGVAGNLSAVRVQEAAMALEQSLRESPEADTGPHLTALVEAMGQIAAPLTHVSRAQPGEDRSHGSKGSDGEVIPVMRRLAALLAEDNMEAEDCLEELRGCLDHDCFPDAWQRLEKGIANLDFDSAKKSLQEIASQLEPEGVTSWIEGW